MSQILLDPSIYIPSKVSEEICKNINLIADLRRQCDDLKTVDSMGLWPSADVLVQIERKFSDSLSYLDIHGVDEPQKRRKDGPNETKEMKSINLMENPNLEHVTSENFSLPKIHQNVQEETQH